MFSQKPPFLLPVRGSSYLWDSCQKMKCYKTAFLQVSLYQQLIFPRVEITASMERQFMLRSWNTHTSLCMNITSPSVLLLAPDTMVLLPSCMVGWVVGSSRALCALHSDVSYYYINPMVLLLLRTLWMFIWMRNFPVFQCQQWGDLLRM